MKILAQFNAYASDYQIKGELSQVRAVPGIISYELMSKVSGEAQNFCLTLDVEDDKAEAVAARLKQMASSYAGDVTKTSVSIFKVV